METDLSLRMIVHPLVFLLLNVLHVQLILCEISYQNLKAHFFLALPCP